MPATNPILAFLRIPYFDVSGRSPEPVAFQTHHRCRDRDSIALRTAADLQNDFTPVMSTISGDTYTGVPLWTFLDASDPMATDQVVITQGTDGYEVVLSLAELNPALGGNPNDLLPYADTGTDFPTDAVARTIFPNDNKHGRWESNLDFVEVASVPEPASFGLLAVALMCVAGLRHRRRGAD
jgi:PEP-CTERM motif